MKRLLVIGSILLALAVAGCDLFGTEDTSIYVWGMIYADPDYTEPLEGATVHLRGDSATVYSTSAQTNADGRFFIEAQVYPTVGDGEGGTGYSATEYGWFGLDAYYQGASHVYADLQEDPFFLGIGDTLRVEDIYLGAGSGGNGR